MRTNTRTNFFTGHFALAAALSGALLVSFVTRADAKESGELFNWTGFYIGGNLGGILSNYEFNDYTEFVDVEEQFFGPPSFPGDTGDLFFIPSKGQTDGAAIGGVQTGYLFQFGHIVVGVEGDIARTATHAKQQFIDTAVIDSFVAGPDDDESAVTDFRTTRTAETNWVGSARLRLGFASGRFLFYATGGGAWANVKIGMNDSASTNFFTNPPPIVPRPTFTTTPPTAPRAGGVFQFNQTNSLASTGNETWLGGWTAGAGAEVALTDMLSFGLEYRHSDFGDETQHFTAHGGPIFPGSRSSNIDFDSDQVTIKFNVLLNHFFGH